MLDDHLYSGRIRDPELRSSEASASWPPTLSSREVILLALTVYVFCGLGIEFLDSYWERVVESSNNPGYAAISAVIRDWNFDGIPPTYFWGLPLVTALIATIAPLSDIQAILLLSFFSSMMSVALAYRLWGGWVTAAFIILSWDWIQKSTLGATEPFFILLLFGAFWAARTERWPLAGLLVSYSGLVRPVGFLALFAIVWVLFRRKNFFSLAWVCLISLTIIFLYLLVMALIMGDPFVNFRTYQRGDWSGISPIGFPFFSLWQGFIHSPEPISNVMKTACWVLGILVGTGAMVASKKFRQFAKIFPVEGFFAGFYAFFLFSYNAPVYAWTEFPRFAIPIIPFALLALENLIPQDRRLIWGGAILSAWIAAASAVNIRYAWAVIQKMLPGS